MPKIFALVLAAGQGTRIGDALPKQYLPIAGKPMMFHSIEALASVPRIERVFVVLAPMDRHWGGHDWSALPDKVEGTFCGGSRRAESVANSLEHLKERIAKDDWVLVHDAARCLVRPEWIDRLIDVCADDPVGGLLAMPVADTLKRETAGRVLKTLPRDAVWQAQTPQMFRLGPLADALEYAGSNATDEASAMEWQGLSPRIVPGSSENFKITQPEDFALAEAVLRSRRLS